MKSAVVNGSPSDHFIPSRRWKVSTVWSSDISHPLAAYGIASLSVGSARNRNALRPRCMSPQSDGPVRAARSSPP